MNYLYNLFFDTSYESSIKLIEEFLIFLLISGIVFYFIYLVLNKLFSNRSKIHRDFLLGINFLWTIVLFEFLVGGLFFFFLFRFQGISFLSEWQEASFWLGLFHQIVLFFIIIPIIFVSAYNRFNNSIKQTIKKQ